MLVTLLGIVTLVNQSQPSNAEAPMLVTLSGIVTLVGPVQFSNALYPMLVTVPATPGIVLGCVCKMIFQGAESSDKSFAV